MGGKSSISEIIKFAGTYISVCIGSGFATGQEIMQFFSAHGIVSILSNLICMGLLAYCGSSLLEIGKTQKLRSSNDIFTYLCGNYIGGFFKLFMPIFFFCSFMVMISGAGASINQYYGIDKQIGSIIIGLLALVSVLMGMNKVIDILGNIGPIIAIMSVGVGVVTIARNYESLCDVNQILTTIDVTKPVDHWLTTSIIYTGLNLIIATPFLVGVGSTAKKKSSCIWGGIIGGVLFMAAAIALNLGIMSDIENIYITEIPTLYMADKIGPIVGAMFSLMLIAGIYTTAVPLLWTVCTSYFKEKSSKFTGIAIFCTVLGIIGGRLPFATLVKLIYPLSGMFGVIILISIFVNKIKNNVFGINIKYKGL
ncbi:YkvI family membrane protein [Romboutsia sp. 1001285H_161024_C4]|uniref:YkvI family membrane protein n=1 Tax=Romboutsia sp. 1001285H_161024_C4 TaxID=2787109 RepID=UPI001896CAC7|nr:hypothetical protein [Romboutsia sp. 1001285H_161024_C4]